MSEAASVDAVATKAAPPGAVVAPPDPGLESALLALIDKASDPVRVAIAPVIDDDKARAELLQARMARLLIASDMVEVVSASRVERTLKEKARQAKLEQAAQEIGVSFAADHILIGEVISAGGEAELALKLINTERGTVIAQAQAPVEGEAKQTSVDARTVRGALRLLSGDLAQVLEQLPGDKRYQRLAVAPLEAKGEAAQSSRLDRFVQVELSRALAEEGFLVVERERLSAALDQIALGAALDEADAPQVGLALDAQAIVVGTVAEAGDHFDVNVRVLSVADGDVIGAGTASLRRENTVSLANRAVETRTPGDAFFRSAVAPGWGQFYNQQPIKGALFSAVTIGAALTTVGLAGGSVAAWFLYQSATPNDALSGAQRTQNIVFARTVRDGAIYATAGMALITAGLWSTGAADALITALYAE